MNRFRWLITVWLILLVGVISIMIVPHASLANENPRLRQELLMADQSRVYEDIDYAFEYPADWEAMILIEQSQPYPEPEKIVRKYAVAGPEGYVTISVFLAQGLELPAWLENKNRTSPNLFPAIEANATVAGYPAVAFVTDNNLLLFISDGKYVYRFWHPLTGSISALQANWHLLNTFRVRKSDAVSVGVQVSQSVMDEVQYIVETTKNQINSNCSWVQGDGCCADAPAIPACYRFPCSVRNGQHWGNCTYYVCYRYGGVPFSGNAGTWWGQVPTTPGWYQHSTPPNGTSIAWWRGGLGHVGFIESYWGGGAPTVREQNWCDTCTRTRQTWAQGYIQKGLQLMMVPLSGNMESVSD